MLLKRSVLAIVTAMILTVAGATVVYAQWPTTCVELNDIVEAHLGNHGNVGIYQRAFGDQAEAACRNDHRGDVRSVFAWAIGGTEVLTPAPAQPPVSPPAQSFSTHPSFETVRLEAIQRGASEELAVQIANSVISRGAVQAFLNGTDSGVEYGTVQAVTVRDFKNRWLDTSGSCWEISYQFKLRNNTSNALFYDWIDLIFLDADGFEVDEDTIFDVTLLPRQERQFSGTELICDGLGPQIKSWQIEFTRL